MENFDLLNSIKLLWELEEKIVDCYKTASKAKNVRAIKTEKEKFDKLVNQLKIENKRFQKILQTIEEDSLKTFALNQFKFFQMSIKVNTSMGKKNAPNNDEYLKTRKASYDEAYSMMAKLALDLADQLRNSK